jgi:hypothetical protein
MEAVGTELPENMNESVGNLKERFEYQARALRKLCNAVY